MTPPRPRVEAALFQRGWSRVGGRIGLPDGADHRVSRAVRSAAQMVSAASGARAAVFKVIRNGGCQSPAQLRNQLAYVGTKAAAVFDSRGLLDRPGGLGARDLDAATRRLASDWRPGPALRLGHTAHLLMSFPVGTPPRFASAVAEAVCAGAFQRPGAHFEYVAALHTDRAHPHVHVVVSRHAIEGGLLTLRPDGPYSYQAFREAMVKHAAHHGLALEATGRLDRGRLAYAARDPEVRRARDRGRPSPERLRTGHDLEAAVRAVAGASRTYQGLAVQARQEALPALSRDLTTASAVLIRGGALTPTSSMSVRLDTQAFVSMLKTVAATVRGVEDRIAANPPDRTRLREGLQALLTALPCLDPSSHARNIQPQHDSALPSLSPAPSRGVAPPGVTRSDFLDRVADRLGRTDPAAPAFASRAQAEAFRAEVERRLGPADSARLARGDPDVLARLADRPLDRLTLAKAYLQARGAAPDSPALRAVTLGLAQAQLALKRERLSHDLGGPVHG